MSCWTEAPVESSFLARLLAIDAASAPAREQKWPLSQHLGHSARLVFVALHLQQPLPAESYQPTQASKSEKGIQRQSIGVTSNLTCSAITASP